MRKNCKSISFMNKGEKTLNKIFSKVNTEKYEKKLFMAK